MNRALIPAVLALLLLIAVSAGYIIGYRMLAAARAEARALTEEVEAREAQVAQVAAAKSALFTLSADEAFFQSYFVSTSTIVSYLEEVESTGDELGTEVDIVSVTPQGGDRLALSVRISGSFRAAMRTLGALEFGPHDTRASNVTLSAVDGAWTLTAVFSVGTRPPQTP